ncbi:MAG: SMP-30/gluconolactonase/LRE family protein [Spirochaeta sp.]|nr:SMP-30/gluconolactonase/LRE family protein [Spirochaeta sp.]
MTATPDYEIISPVQNTLGEGPIWDTRDGRFYWVDAYQNRFYSTAPEPGAAGSPPPGSAATPPAEPAAHHTGFFTIGVTPWGTSPGQFLLAADNALYRWDAGAATPVVPDPFTGLIAAPTVAGATVPADALTSQTHRFNDVIAGPAGEYYAGIMEWQPGQYGRRGTGALVLFTDRHSPHVVMSGVRLPNGMGFSPDIRWFYFTDSLARTIYRFPYNADNPVPLGPPEPFIRSDDRPGVPDGLTVAADGSLLSARWGASSVDHYAPDGTLLCQYAVPMHQPSSVCFGDTDGATLLVTSATEGMDAAEISRTDSSGSAVEGITIALELELHGPAEHHINASF